jgi:hypothetical protein
MFHITLGREDLDSEQILGNFLNFNLYFISSIYLMFDLWCILYGFLFSELTYCCLVVIFIRICFYLLANNPYILGVDCRI